MSSRLVGRERGGGAAAGVGSGVAAGLLQAVARACQATCENNEQTCLTQSSSSSSRTGGKG